MPLARASVESSYSTPAPVSATRRVILPPEIREYLKKAKPPAPLDPEAIEKVRLERYLKKFGLTLDALPHDFLTHDEDTRGFLLGQVVGPVMAERRAAKRAAERLKRRIEGGYPANYYSHPDDERRRISDAVRQRRRRAKRAEAATTPPSASAVPNPREWLADKLIPLKKWTKEGASPRAREWRGREREIVKAAWCYRKLTDAQGHGPSHGKLAREIGCKRRTAQNYRKTLIALYAVGGPWWSKAA